MRVLLTGAGGFSGSHVAKALLARGHDVTAVTGRRSDGRLPEMLGPDAPGASGRLIVLRGDLADDAFGLPREVDAIIHAAALSLAPGVAAADIVRCNVDATARLVRHGLESGIGTCVFFSSLSLHGQIAGPSVDDRTPSVDPDIYGLTKKLGEVLLAEAAGALRSRALRLPGVIGPQPVRNWMTSVLAAAREGHVIPVYNPAAPYNNIVHVDGVAAYACDLIADAGWSGFAGFPLGAAGTVTVRHAVETIVDGLGGRASIEDLGPKQPCFVIDNNAAAASGFHPQEVEAVLRRFVAENLV